MSDILLRGELRNLIDEWRECAEEEFDTAVAHTILSCAEQLADLLTEFELGAHG